MVEINNILESLFYLDDLISNTKIEKIKIDSFLNDYDFAQQVQFPILNDTTINAQTVKLVIPDDKKSLFKQNDVNTQEYIQNFFVKKNELFSVSNQVNIIPSKEPNFFLTTEYVDDNTAVVSPGIFSFNFLNTSQEFSLASLKELPTQAISLKIIKEIIPLKNHQNSINFDIKTLNMMIRVGYTGSNITLDNTNLIFNDFNLESFTLIAKNINNLDTKVNIQSLHKFFLFNKDAISHSTVLPIDTTNITVFKDLLELPYVKAGDKAFIEVKDYTSLDDLDKIIGLHFKNDGNDIFFDDNRLVSKDELDAVLSKIIQYYSII